MASVEYNIICQFVEADGFSSDGFYWNDLTIVCLRPHYNKHQNKNVYDDVWSPIKDLI